jgi:hypothetical protein
MAHHNLGSSRATPSHLGGFTFKSNKCHKDCFTKLKCSNHSQRGISQPKLGFGINHSNLTNRCWGELTKALGWEFSLVELVGLKGGKGEAFKPSPKTNHWKLASRNWNIRFWNRNIWNLKYSRYRKNWTLWFGKPYCLVFPSSVRSVVYKAIVFHSSRLGF